jgi:hypothetical protein
MNMFDARRVHYISLDIADAPCEAKCADQGNSAKCIVALVTLMSDSEGILAVMIREYVTCVSLG